MDVKFHMMVRCSCGWGLEEDKDAVPCLGTVTVKPCPVYTGKARYQPDQEGNKYNRRGVMVDERST